MLSSILLKNKFRNSSLLKASLQEMRYPTCLSAVSFHAWGALRLVVFTAEHVHTTAKVGFFFFNLLLLLFFFRSGTSSSWSSTTAELSELFFASSDDFVDVLSFDLLEETGELLSISFNANRGQDGLHIFDGRRGVSAKNSKHISSNDTHVE